MIGMGFGMIFFWGLIIVGVLYLTGHWTRRETTGRIEKTATEILKERYARGEISKEKFDEMKKDLTKVA